jgi:hypothetical protein
MSYGEEKLHKQKRSFRVVYPGVTSGIQPAWCNAQLEGAAHIVEDGCKLLEGKPYELTHCFIDTKDGYLRVRSPLFLVSFWCRIIGCTCLMLALMGYLLNSQSMLFRVTTKTIAIRPPARLKRVHAIPCYCKAKFLTVRAMLYRYPKEL